MAHDGVTPRLARDDFLDRADVIDGGGPRVARELD